MIARVAATAFVALAAATAAGATAIPRGGDSKCNTGSLSCCNQLYKSDSAEGQWLLGLLNVALGTVTGQVGVNCSPINVIGGLSGTSCKQEPVCCENNAVGTVISLGCVPVSL
ncbi:fungal hydrophobin-domain-containing protein [Trametes polyzona]|nr:fungal hydrophobin-domain-containing protein [Trametes polyzona]